MSSLEVATRRGLFVYREECGLATMQMLLSAAFGYGTLAVLDVDVGFWPTSEFARCTSNVGFCGLSGPVVLSVSSSHFDPNRKLLPINRRYSSANRLAGARRRRRRSIVIELHGKRRAPRNRRAGDITEHVLERHHRVMTLALPPLSRPRSDRAAVRSSSPSRRVFRVPPRPS